MIVFTSIPFNHQSNDCLIDITMHYIKKAKYYRECAGESNFIFGERSPRPDTEMPYNDEINEQTRQTYILFKFNPHINT